MSLEIDRRITVIKGDITKQEADVILMRLTAACLAVEALTVRFIERVEALFWKNAIKLGTSRVAAQQVKRLLRVPGI
jgi:hypothetical protein